MKTTALMIALALTALAGVPAAAESSWTYTGPKGGTAQGAQSCSAGGGTVTCNRSSTATGAYGRTASKNVSRVGTADGVSVTGTRTGFGGGQANWSRQRSR